MSQHDPEKVQLKQELTQALTVIAEYEKHLRMMQQARWESDWLDSQQFSYHEKAKARMV